ncbi:hypothetical protein KSF_087140 [Reticulibacter mediterranei]|uniref:Uncharacterized protein n=1 Tax=Reticulibacter mediterranei TaxID=2778369 RepID=A0A8J3IQ26_9CHLR|nr:hypothetical protein [Reticulibacter mediterranei]GHO98666.1 hypothetical protein KSF_087140 [Reticulibacter mediterranei]
MSLHALYEEFCTLPVASEEEEPQAIQRTFERLIQTLSSPDVLSLPQELLSLMAFFAELLKRHALTLALCEEEEISAVTFAVRGNRQEQTVQLCILFPSDYLAQVRANPLEQLGEVVCLASQARDCLCQRLDQDVSLARGCVYMAVFLQAMRPLHEQERLIWALSETQQFVLETFPEGLSSALVYPTPPLMILNRLEN